MNRRQFLEKTLAAGAVGTVLGALRTRAEDKPAQAPALAPVEFKRKIRLGVVGLGGRGNWIAGLFRRHGGYEMHAVADYFPEVANANGAVLGVDASRRFSGLSGYKRVIESGVEAIVIIDIPYFYPEQAEAAVDAGLHMYMAKPVAADVPGTLEIGRIGKRASNKQRVFLVDYQMPTDPLNAEVIRRVGSGGLGPLQTIFSNGAAGGDALPDPALTKTLESRMQHLIWVNDDALGCGYIGNYDIHIVDAVLRATGRLPASATGWGGRYRPAPHGDALDSTCVLYTFEDGMVWNHQSVKGGCDAWFSADGSLAAEIQGRDGSARVSYWGKAYVRGGPQHFGGGAVQDLYEAGAVRNIGAFYDNVTQGRFANESVQRAVDSALVCILGREAAARRTRLTLAEVVRENRRLEADLRGLRS
jgi:predicted dehydrogenase